MGVSTVVDARVEVGPGAGSVGTSALGVSAGEPTGVAAVVGDVFVGTGAPVVGAIVELRTGVSDWLVAVFGSRVGLDVCVPSPQHAIANKLAATTSAKSFLFIQLPIAKFPDWYYAKLGPNGCTDQAGLPATR